MLTQLKDSIWRYHDEMGSTSYLIVGKKRAAMVDCGGTGKPVMPLIRSSITICLFLAIVRSFMVFEVNMSLTDGGPYNSTEMIAYRIYNQAFVSLKFGDAQAQAVILFIIVALISVLQAYFTSRKEVEL